MYRDMEKGRPIEADQIIGDLLARGRQAKSRRRYLPLPTRTS